MVGFLPNRGRAFDPNLMVGAFTYNLAALLLNTNKKLKYPKIDPCGKPKVISKSDKHLLIVFYFVRKYCNHSFNRLHIP